MPLLVVNYVFPRRVGISIFAGMTLYLFDNYLIKKLFKNKSVNSCKLYYTGLDELLKTSLAASKNRHHTKPIMPKILEKNQTSLKIPVHPLLASYVKNITLETAKDALPASPYKVLPDLFVVMGFQYSGALSLLMDGKKNLLKRCGISGLQTRFKEFQPEHTQTKTLLIKFYPWAIPLLFKESAHHLHNQAIGLAELIGYRRMDLLEEELLNTEDTSRLANAMQTFLIQLHLTSDKSAKTDIISLTKEILANPQINSVNSLAKNYGYSTRTLERHFKEMIGLSPKKFLQVKRFQQTFKQLQTNLPISHILANNDYYDQAHFINEFKQISGFTPGEIIGR